MLNGTPSEESSVNSFYFLLQRLVKFGWWLTLLVILTWLLWLILLYTAGAFYLQEGSRLLNEKDSRTAVGYLETTLRFEPDNAMAYRQLAKVYLQVEDLDQALTTAQQAVTLAPHNPAVQLEIGDIYDRLGNVEQAITHYEAGLVGDRGPQLTANYLQMADRLWADGDLDKASAIWQNKVRGIGYGDLYANWRLAQYYAGDEEIVSHYREAVRYFRLESVAPPPDPRLTTYQAQAILGTVTEGLWSRETLLNVVSYRVWQDQANGTEDLLKTLVAAIPDDADLGFYLGELYHRRGDWQQAEAAYQKVLDVKPGHSPAYLRLGMVAEQRQALPEAIIWYKQYYKMAPDDLLALRKLTEINEALGTFEAKELRSELEKRTDGRYVAAKLLDVTPEQVELGPNLVKNGDFEEWQNGVPVGWRLGSYLGANGHGGIYIAGVDTLVSDKKAARIAGLRGGQMPDGTVTFSEYVGQNIEASDASYLISVYYNSWGFTNNQKGFFFLGDYTRPNGLKLIQETLPDPMEQLMVAHFLVEGPAITTQITPLMRIFGGGNLTIQAFSIQRITF